MCINNLGSLGVQERYHDERFQGTDAEHKSGVNKIISWTSFMLITILKG